MIEKLINRLNKDLNDRKEKNLYREVKLYSGYRCNLSSNDYFQLRYHPKVISKAKEACEIYGTGSGASPLLSGFLPCHKDLLDEILKWKQKPSGMLFNSGYAANQSILKYLPGKNDLILADRLVHNSIAQALKKCPAKFKRYGHLDLDDLEKLLQTHQEQYESIFVITESVFSMDGDYPNLNSLVALKKKFPFVLVLDEAHGSGVFGPTGGGLAEEMGVLPEIDILVGTLGKSLGSMGAYVLANNQSIIEYLTNEAGEYIYSTFMSPAQAAAALQAVKLIKKYDTKRKKLRELSKYLRKAVNPSSEKYLSPIVPVLIGDSLKTIKIRDVLLEKGILVGAVRPPTVPANTSRLRVSLNSEINKSVVDELLNILEDGKKC